MARMYFAEWSNINVNSENYEDYDRVAFPTIIECKRWLGDKLKSSDYDCAIFYDDENNRGHFTVVLRTWLP